MIVNPVLLRFHVEESNAIEGIFATSGAFFDEHLQAAQAVADNPECYLQDVEALHSFFQHSLESEARPNGVFRNVSVCVGAKDMPHFSYVPALMRKWYALVQRLHAMDVSSENSLVLARLIHHEFLCIHPFADGNGRCARLLLNAFILSKGGTWAIIIRDKKSEYIASIRQYEQTAFKPRFPDCYSAT